VPASPTERSFTPARRDGRRQSTSETGKEAWRTKVGDIQPRRRRSRRANRRKNQVLLGNPGRDLACAVTSPRSTSRAARVMERLQTTGPDSEVKIGPAFSCFYARNRGRTRRQSWPGPSNGSSAVRPYGDDLLRPGKPSVLLGPAILESGTPRPASGRQQVVVRDNRRGRDTGEDGGHTRRRRTTPGTRRRSWKNVSFDMDYAVQAAKLLDHPGRLRLRLRPRSRKRRAPPAENVQPRPNWASGYDNSERPEKQRGVPQNGTRYGTVTKGICHSDRARRT